MRVHSPLEFLTVLVMHRDGCRKMRREGTLGSDLNAPEGNGRIRIGLQADIAGGFPVLLGDAPHDVWLRIMRQISTSQMIETLGIKHVPADPSLN